MCTDFGFCLVNDDVAQATYAKLQRANHQNLFSLALFSPDSADDLRSYIQKENDELKAEIEADTV
jgi:hypothetical protein